jgi:dihydrofolate reductase
MVKDREVIGMRKVIVSMFVTLDGFIAGPNSELDWMPGNQTPDTEVDAYILDMLDEMDTILLGGTTYRLFVEYWPTITTSQEAIADKLNRLPKVVFSRSLDTVRWGRWDNARLASGTLVDEINHLQQQGGKDMVMFGGARLARSLRKLELVDEYRLFLSPLLLWGGQPLFEETNTRTTLELSSVTAFKSGCVLLVHTPRKPGAS